MANPFAIRNFPTPKDSQLAGAYVPRHISDGIALIALFRGWSRSKYIREILMQAHEKQFKIVPEKNYIRTLAGWAQEEWDRRKEKNKSNPDSGWDSLNTIKIKFEGFRQEMLQQLILRGLSRSTIEKILDKVNQ